MIRNFSKFALALIFILGCGSGLSSDGDYNAAGAPDGSASFGLTEDNWDVAYTGYGETTFANGVLTIAPEAIGLGSGTHSALVLSRSTQDNPVADFELTIRATTMRQFREPSPNPWETLWILFNYIPQGDYKETNYFVLKTNGIELGKAYNERGQTYLHTGDAPKLQLGVETTYRLIKIGQDLSVYIDGDLALEYDGGDLYDHAGSIGLYVEDSQVSVSRVEFNSLDGGCCS